METAALLMLDIDNFKYVNDNYGHAAGDAVLKAVAADLTCRVRAQDMVARRYHGGRRQFPMRSIIRSGRRAAETVSIPYLARRRRTDGSTSTAAIVDYEGRQIGCRASIGSQVITGDEKDIDEVLLGADHAMYGVRFWCELRRSTR